MRKGIVISLLVCLVCQSASTLDSSRRGRCRRPSILFTTADQQHITAATWTKATDEAYSEVIAQGIPCRVGCCSHHFYLEGTEGLLRLQKLLVEKSLSFLDIFVEEPRTVLVVDAGVGLETVALSLLLPNASIIHVTGIHNKHARTALEHNLHAIANVQVQYITDEDSAEPNSTRAFTEKVGDMNPQESSLTGIKDADFVLLTSPQAIAIIPHIEDSRDILAADVLVVDQTILQDSDSSAVLPDWVVAVGDYQHIHHRGWDVYMRRGRLRFLQQQQELGKSMQGFPLLKKLKLLQQQQQQQQLPKVKVFYHLAAMHSYKEIVKEHFSRLVFSGLYDKAEGVYCFILAPSDADAEDASGLVRSYGSKVHVVETSTDVQQAERFTLLGLAAHLAPTDKFLYMHSKGLRHSPSNMNVHWWSFYMQYFLVKEHKLCLELLQDFDTVGVDWSDARPKDGIAAHYSGNFWWATASYYLTLKPQIGDGYLDPEFYVASNQPRHVSLWQSNVDMYKTLYQPLHFTDSASLLQYL